MERLLLLFALFIVTFGCAQNNINSDNTSIYKDLQDIKLDLKPNIIWIVCEDQMPTLGCFGDAVAKTPNLDKLASEGVRFTNVFSTAGVCAPSRSALITGMYQNGIGTQHMRTLGDAKFLPVPRYSAVIPSEVKCYSELLRIGGYYCTNNSKEDYQFIAPVTAWDESSNKAHWENREKDQPFFAIFNISVCHESGMWRNKNHPLVVDPADVIVPPYYPDNEVVRNEIARNYSNLYEMDSIAGKLLNDLETAGLLENTVVFFYSDHGGPLPRQKREIYDTGLKVPLIIRFPDQQKAGESIDELISFVDFAPTLLSLSHLPIPEYIQGQAFLGSEQTIPRKYIYAARDRLDNEYDMVRGVRDGRYKYLKNFQPEKPYIMNITYRLQMDLMNELIRANEAGELNDEQKLWFADSKPEEELYDLKNDPYELVNLINEPSLKDKADELRSALRVWMDDIDDKGLMSEEEMLSEMWEGKDHPPLTTTPEIEINNDLVSITCETRGASIGYKIIKGDSEPKSWEVYTQPFKMSKKEKILFQAHRIGFEPSEIQEYKK